MATAIFFRKTTTHPRAIPQNGYRDMTAANAVTSAQNVVTDAVTPDERFFLSGGIPTHWWSERVTAEVTISGSITFDIRAKSSDAAFTGRLRAKLYKITAGGSNVESFIAQADASADIVLAFANYTFSVTPSAPVTVAPNERFICRMSVLPVAGSFGTGTATITFGDGNPSLAYSKITFTETFTTRLNGVTLFARNTSAIGIGAFKDLSQTMNTGASTPGVVNTTAGGTEIQWTLTAGGSVLEWIGPRLKSPGWSADAIGIFGSHIFLGNESNAAANCTFRYKAFRRQPSGTETLVATWTYTTAELPTSSAARTLTVAMGTLAQVTPFAEDDRIVLRAYIVPFTALTMGGGFTCTINYDGVNIATAVSLVLLDSPELKAEGDPDGTSSISGGLMMGGVGN